MDYSFESGLDKLNDEALKYVGVTNLDFKTHLSKDELVEVQNLIFSINTLLQVTFKDGTGICDIEDVKHMIELSPMCDDKKIEKLILRKNTREELKKILSMPYQNPNSWHIAYDIKENNYMLTTIPNYRIMEEYIDIVLSCVKDDMSPLEKIKEIYDFVKLLDLKDKGSSRLPDVIRTRIADNLGFSLLLKELLNRIGISSYVAEINRSQKENIIIAYVKDEKYHLNGLYVFDPASDSIPKAPYNSEAIRKVNYNFFAIPLYDIENTKDQDKLMGITKFLVSDSLDYAERQIDQKERKNLEKNLCKKYDELFAIVKKTKRITDEKKLDLIISTLHQEDFLGINRNIEELIKNNYYLRKKEIFNEDNDSEMPVVIIHDV